MLLPLVLSLVLTMVHSTYFLAAFICCVFPRLFQLPQDVLVSFFFITWPQKKLTCVYVFQFMSDLAVSTSPNTVSFLFFFFVAHEIRSILRRNHISVPPVSFVAVLKLSRPRIHKLGWVQQSTPGLSPLVLMEIYLLAPISFSGNFFFLPALFLIRFQCCCVHRLILIYSSI